MSYKRLQKSALGVSEIKIGFQIISVCYQNPTPYTPSATIMMLHNTLSGKTAMMLKCTLPGTH